MLVILWLSGSLISLIPAVPIMRHVWDLWDTQTLNYNECYHVIMNTETDALN